MRAHSSSRQSVAPVNDVGAAEHGDPEICLVCKGVTPAHSATANTFSLWRLHLLFLVSSLAKRRLILTTGHSLCFYFFLGLVSASLFLANALALMSPSPLFRSLWVSALFLSETVISL
ncbi:hypothetical protein PF010_g14295 [Phytophthora fragariae]|uniref:Uncharacterized protein n=1 Tax=Phytophthora fragariae TaxID=53985 RepID=A0A6A4D7X0_9STRA|nr:hypothetical protein PF003_g3733 [Phytophthora fragariae]KAE8938000.1 hypothetical protein PF009_g12106 [Phytophthora fragariae]KAE9101896.1 hypothetical protein PF010_g14295 [Phytophthora fragariae]KAE9103697.1 hypothetical protein PF007_g14314 [Phytophthora fragariae]KAE9141988.1 hypothetical protein PF006_g12864 [Phytophthora fragariae]